MHHQIKMKKMMSGIQNAQNNVSGSVSEISLKRLKYQKIHEFAIQYHPQIKSEFVIKMPKNDREDNNKQFQELIKNRFAQSNYNLKNSRDLNMDEFDEESEEE